GGVFLLRVLRTPEAPAVSDAPAETTPAAAQAPAPAPAELATKAEPDEKDPSAIESPGPTPPREPVGVADGIPAAARRDAGKVVFATGAPAEERVEVLAYVSGAANAPRSKPRRFPVAADGAFRAAFPKGTEKGTLDVGARFLYISAPLEVAPSTRGADAPAI